MGLVITTAASIQHTVAISTNISKSSPQNTALSKNNSQPTQQQEILAMITRTRQYVNEIRLELQSRDSSSASITLLALDSELLNIAHRVAENNNSTTGDSGANLRP